MDLRNTRFLPLAGAAGAALALAIAKSSEIFMGLIPCALCLLQRQPYRVAIAVGLLGALLPRRASRLAAWLVVALYLAAGGVGTTHVGVEQHWWPSPLPQCTTPNLAGLSVAERLARLPDRPSKSCEDPDYPIAAIPLTYAQASVIYALAGAGLLSMLLVRRGRPEP